MNAIGFVLFGFLAIAASGHRELTDSEIMEIVDDSCKPANAMCPKKEFAISSEFHIWNAEVVMESPLIQLVRDGRVPAKSIMNTFKNEFCCDKGACLADCGLFDKVEVPLVAAFPMNVKAIFALEMPELQVFRPAVERYIAKYGFRRSKIYASEIEEYFDFVARNQKTIQTLLDLNKSSL